MKAGKINWIILSSKDRGTTYGVGTFIKNLSTGLAASANINVSVIEIGISDSNEPTIIKEAKITYFKIPSIKYPGVAPNTVGYQTKLAKSIVHFVKAHILPDSENIVHLNFVFQYFIGSEFARQMNCKIIFTQHLFIYDFPDPLKGKDIEKLTYDLVDHFVTVTQHGKVHLMKKKIPSEKITVIYNGMDHNGLIQKTEKKVLIEKYGLNENENIVLYSGRVDEIKGLEYLSKAFNLLLQSNKNCRLVIAGDGEMDNLIKWTRPFSTHVSILGFIPLADILGLYSMATIGVISSLEEHCSYVALEMMHCGLPVVATKVGGLAELFQHNQNALLVKMTKAKANQYGLIPDTEMMADCMKKLINNAEIRNLISNNSLARAKSIFTSQTMVQEYLKVASNM